MATYYSANQYEGAFKANTLQSWTIPKQFKERPSTREGYTQFVADERGHLLPGVPRSKTNPWGTFMGTWEMPSKIPPAKLHLTSRSAESSKRLTNWIQNSTPLLSACNGLRPDIKGKASEDIQEIIKQNSRTCKDHTPEIATRGRSPGAAAQSPSGSDKASRECSRRSVQDKLIEKERGGSSQKRSSSCIFQGKEKMREI
ncbi:protein Flattop [Pelodytes ibericus]